MKNHLLEKLHPMETSYSLFANLYNPQLPKGKKLCSNFSFFNFGQTMVKLLIQEVLILLHNYSRILVLLNNYFNFLNFGQIWSNFGQTMAKLLIQEILVLLNNYCLLE